MTDPSRILKVTICPTCGRELQWVRLGLAAGLVRALPVHQYESPNAEQCPDEPMEPVTFGNPDGA